MILDTTSYWEAITYCLKRNTYKLLMQIKQEEKVVLTDGKVISVDDIMDLEVSP